MTGFKSKKALTDRMTEAQKEGLHKQNEWQLGMDKLQQENLKLRELLHKLTGACDCWGAVQERMHATRFLDQEDGK